MMIYLDHAAGSYGGKKAVAAAMSRSLTEYGANPGRGGHRLSRQAAVLVEGVREQAAALLGVSDRRRIIFTAGATASLNQAIYGLLAQGGHAVCSSMEHNAVRRPLRQLTALGRCRFDLARADSQGRVSAAAYQALLKPDTKLMIVNHGSNVNGAVQPLAELAALAQREHIPLLVDAAQSGGLLPLNAAELGQCLLALPGHKGLGGPAGVGLLYVAPGLELLPLLSGGTGGDSESPRMPELYPQHLEAGSLPVPAIAGLGAALTELAQEGCAAHLEAALALTLELAQGLAQLPGLVIQEPGPGPRLPVISCTLAAASPQAAEAALDRAGVCVRAGYHCSPWAHQTLATFAGDGSLRFSPSHLNSRREIRQTLNIMKKILRQA